MKKSTLALVIVLGISLIIGYYWDSLPIISESVHAVLDPTFGALIEWNNLIGFLITTFVISFILVLSRKFFTDQKELKRLKEEHKALQKQMKEFQEHPEKMKELMKKQMELTPQMFHLSMRSFTYTGIPVILFFRWFQETLHPIYGGWWLLWYLIATMIISSIISKKLDIA